jgi:hypothetical protein
MAEAKATADQPAAAEVSPAGGVAAVDPHLAAVLSPEALKARQDLLDDWSQFVAVTDIPFGNVLAYAAGDPVPASNVRRWKYDDQGLVAKRSTKEGKAALDARAATSPSAVKAPGDA